MERPVAALAVLSLLLGSLPATTLGAHPTRHIGRVDVHKIDPSFRPYLADAERKLDVVLQLAADPAVIAAGLTNGQRQAKAHALRDTQATLDVGIKSHGGRVTGRFQYAYNGIRVQTTGSHLADLAALPGVVGVRRLQTYEPGNIQAVPYIGVPTAWQTGGATGAGQTIAIIDTGIDYTHANFGGPGTTAAYSANDPTVLEPGSFPTAKVIAGYDFAGNDYDAAGDLGPTTPSPDPDPLDCNDHGTHVAGTAAGQGVLADHSTYTGPYGPSLYADPTDFVVGPGVAPRATLVSLKVFGCEGRTSLVVDALEWVAAYNVTHADRIDVVNMSLGSDFGTNDNPDVVATNNLVDTGVVVIVGAANSDTVPYIVGSPSTATKAISVAALDAFATFPAATIQLPSGAAIAGINQTAYPSLALTGLLHVLDAGGGAVKVGCSASDFDPATAGKIVAVKRGECSFDVKAPLAEAAGAIGIIDINRDDTAAGELPAYFGPFSLFHVPIVGTDKLAQPILLANEGNSITLTDAGRGPNPTYRQIAGFSSSGPRYGDSWLKPDIAAPGVNMVSSLSGSGWDGITMFGTSMATPMISGTAALVHQAHPTWSPLKVKAAITNTADASRAALRGYDPLRAGSGVVRADRAVETFGLATTSDGTASLSFGYEQINGAYREAKQITLWNTSSRDVTYSLSASSALVSLSPSTVKVKARSSATVNATASLSRAKAAALPTADQFITGDLGVLTSLSGVVTARPATSRPGFFALRVPYLLVPRALSDIRGSLASRLHRSGGALSGTLSLTNTGIHSGYADTYALGLLDRRGDGAHGTDIRAVGVQSIPASILTGFEDPSDRDIQFALNSWDQFSTASPSETDIAVDTNDDGTADWWVIGVDEGWFFSGEYDGLYVSIILDASFDYVDAWWADAPTNGSTIILPALASDLGLASGSGSLRYWVAAYDAAFTGLVDETGTSAPFDAFDPAQSSGDFVRLAAGGHTSVPVWADTAAANAGDVKGWLVVTLDDRNGAAQADIVRLWYDHGH